METPTTRWGDLPVVPDTESGIAAIEREQITKPRSMDLDGPLLHQPSNCEYPATYEITSESLFPENIVINTLKLLQHSKKLRTIVQQQQESQKPNDENAQNFPPLPPKPAVFDEQLLQPLKTRNLDASPTEMKSHIFKDDKFPPELNEQCTKLVLRKAVAIICAHAGFESTTDSVLDFLVDVLSEYFTRIIRLLRMAVDREALSKHIGFTDVLEQVFHEIGIGSIKNLYSFYQHRILEYHKHILDICQQLEGEYEKLKHPEQPNDELKSIKIKEETLVQIQFPVSEESDEVMDHGETVIHLEEFHALHNLEHETSTTLADEDGTKWPTTQAIKQDPNAPMRTPKILDSDEEIINVSDSPEETHPIDLIETAVSITGSDSLSSPTSSIIKLGKFKKK